MNDTGNTDQSRLIPIRCCQINVDIPAAAPKDSTTAAIIRSGATRLRSITISTKQHRRDRDDTEKCEITPGLVDMTFGQRGQTR